MASAWCMLALAFFSGIPADWVPVFPSRTSFEMREDRVLSPPEGSVKWLVSTDCMLFLGPGAEVGILPPQPGECARIRHFRGPIRAVASGTRILAVVQEAGETLVRDSVFETGKDAAAAQLRHDLGMKRDLRMRFASETFSPGRFMRAVMARVAEDSVQGSASGGAMCLDSSRSAGDVGNSSSSVIQMPPRARVVVQIPLPERK